MRFLNVNQEELYPILILMIKFIERGDLPAKRRSGVATEDQNNWFFASESGKLNGSFIIVCF